MKPDDEVLADLLVRWEELRDQSREVGPVELAPEYPHLHPELAGRIAVLRATDWIDRTAGPVGGAPPEPAGGDRLSTPRILSGRYRLDRLIAEGGSGQVWAGYDTELERQVAVKVPRPTGGSPRLPVDFLAEGRRVAKLEHPGIVPVYDVGRQGDRYYIISKLVDGESMADRLGHGRVTPAEAARVVADIARSLEFAHRQGFVHRDIKPANVLLDSSDRPYLTDFGIAVAAPELESASRAGTLAYMAPEQLAGDGGRPDHRADIYGLGVVLYEMLAGRQPFQADDPVAVRDAITGGVYRPLREVASAIPAALDRIVSRCMGKAPEQRYQTAGQVADELDAYLRSSTRVFPVKRVASLVLLLLIPVGLVAAGVYHLRPASTPASTEPVPDEPPPQTTPGREAGAAVGANRALARQQLVGHAGRVGTLAYQPKGRWLASGGADKTVRLWDTERPNPSSGHLILRLQDAVTAVAYRSDGARLAVGCGNGQMSVWNVSGAEPKEEAVYPGQEGPVAGLAFSPDGTIILSGGADGKVILRDYNTTPPRMAGFPKLHPVLAVSVAADGRRVTLGYGDKKADPAVFHFWEIDPTKTPRALHHRGSAPLAGAPGIGAMAVSADGARLFAATGSPIGVWEFSTANKRLDLLGIYEKHLRAVRAVAVSPDGRRAASGDEGGAVHVWEVATRETVRAFTGGHTGPVTSVTFSGDGREAASGGEDGVIRLWRLQD